MICPKCKKLIEDGSDYCTYCGAKLTKGKDENLRPLHDILISANSSRSHSEPAKYTSKIMEESRAPFWVGVVCIVLGLVRALFGSIIVVSANPYEDPSFLDVIRAWLGDSSAGISLVLAALGVIIIMLWKKKE